MILLLALAGCFPESEIARPTGSDTGPTEVVVIPAGPTTPPDAGCVSAPIGPAGGTIDADDAQLEVAAETFGGEVVVVELCASGDRTGGWDVRISPPSELATPMTITFRGDDGAVFLPAADGSRIRSILAARPKPGWWTTPTWRPGRVSLQVDDRLLVPFVGRQTAADVLLLIDNSCSMLDEQQKLANRLPDHLLQVLDATGVDYHLGVVATDSENPEDQGALSTVGEFRWIDPTTPDRDEVLAQLVSVGNTGSFEQQGLATVSAALGQNSFGDDTNGGYLREDAALVVIVVSHRDDVSPLAPSDVSSQLLGMSQTRPSVAFHSLVDTVGADRGTRYIAVSHQVGSLVADLVQADWDLFFESIAHDLANAAGMPVRTEHTPELWLTFDDDAEPVRLPDDEVVFEDGVVYGLEVLPPGTTAWVLLQPSS